MLDTLLVSISHNDNDNGVLLVGRKRLNESVEIINAFEGEVAIDIYNMLITKRGKNNGNNDNKSSVVGQEPTESQKL